MHATCDPVQMIFPVVAKLKKRSITKGKKLSKNDGKLFTADKFLQLFYVTTTIKNAKNAMGSRIFDKVKYNIFIFQIDNCQ